MKSSQKHFRTNVLLKSIIGKELINDDNIAILELVKNSYDAGSSKVEIFFKNLKHSNDELIDNYNDHSSKVIIRDYGIGMNGNDIEEKWLNIAYSEKKGKNEINGRMLAGAKGVGRFSCDRLGRYLDLYTRKSNEKVYHLKIDWNTFEVEGEIDLEIQNVPVYLEEMSLKEFYKNTLYKEFDKGTIIEVSKLRETWVEYDPKKKIWTANKIYKLRKNLEKLLNPNQSLSESGFKIFLHSDEFLKEDENIPDKVLKINGEITNVIFNKLNFTSTNISSKIDDDGKFITTTLTDKGRDIFILKENNIYKNLKNINIILYYLNTYSKIYFAKQTGIRSINFGSVFLFINGFRIPPYGDEGDDWLGLGNRKGQGYARNLGTRELIGRIEIIDKENKFKSVSSREGLVKDKVYNTLTEDFFYLTLRRLERFVVDGLDWDRITKKKKNESIENEDIDDNLTARQIVNNFEKIVNSTEDFNQSSNYEKYLESQTVKDRRILSLIDNIIGPKKDSIVDIYINEDLINSLIFDEQKKSTNLLTKLIQELESSFVNEKSVIEAISQATKINSDLGETLSPIMDVLGYSNNQTSILQEFDNNTTEFRNRTEKLLDQIKYLQLKNEEVENNRKKAEDAQAKIEEENQKLQDKLKVEEQKNTYLLSSRKSLGAESDIYIHDIKISTYFIINGLTNLLVEVSANDFTKERLIDKIGTLKIEAERNLKLSQLMTHASFEQGGELKTVDLIGYITQYVRHYTDINDTNDDLQKISFEIEGTSVPFYRKVSILNLSIIIDNIISNSKKWNSKNILIAFSVLDNELIVIFSDDGNGVSTRFYSNYDSIFELGVFDFAPNNHFGSSGIGLYSARKLLGELDGDIKFIGNAVILKGASFQITFR